MSKRNNMIILLLLYTGLRVSELCDIKTKNIDFLTAHLKVGNHLASGVFNRIALFSDIAGLTVAGAGSVCLVNGKIFERINNEGLNYSGLNDSAKGDNVDLKSNILKTYFKMKRAEYEFLAGGMLAIDDNVFSGGLQAFSGYDKGLQPDSAAFKLGKFAGDTASLVAGVAAFVTGGLGDIGGITLDATGVGAIVGAPLTIVSSVAAGVGGAVSLKSANSLIKDGFSMMSGDGGISNEGAGEGNLTGSVNELTKAEQTVVDDLLGQGKNVEIIPRTTASKTPDFLVDGVKTELKSLENPNINTGITRIQKGFIQGAETVIIDGRQAGLTTEQANEILNRATGTYQNKTLPGQVQIWTNDGVIRR